MKRMISAAVTALALAVPGAALADERDPCDPPDRGNHEAVWASDQPEHGLESGSEWGAQIGALASSGGLKPTGVSEGVHLAKCQPVPGQGE